MSKEYDDKAGETLLLLSAQSHKLIKHDCKVNYVIDEKNIKAKWKEEDKCECVYEMNNGAANDEIKRHKFHMKKKSK